jgi:DNA ligase-4
MELKDLVSKCGRPLKQQPSGVVVGREKPVLWYNPSTAPVLQIKAAEIVASGIYPTGCTLRFPRVQCARPDRDHTSCTSVQEVQQLRNQSEGKLFGGLHLVHSPDEELATAPKRPRLAQRPQLSARYTQADYSLERIDTFHLKGRIVVVEPSLDVELKRRLERIVIKHGGTVEQNVRPGITSCYVQSEGKLRAKNVVSLGLVDVVKASWLLDCEVTVVVYAITSMLLLQPILCVDDDIISHLSRDN